MRCVYHCTADHVIAQVTYLPDAYQSLPTMKPPPQRLHSPSSSPHHHRHHSLYRPLSSYLLPLLLNLTLLLSPSTLTHALPLTLVQTYSNPPISLSSHATLHHTVDLPRNSIKLGLVLSDVATLSGAAAWVGIGIGEATSGSMLGADIVTAEFSSSTYNNTCVLTDRYVPWDAYPARPYPVRDGCGRPSDWTLVSCIRDPMSGLVVLEVVRPITVEQGNDVYDRSIVPYENAFLYAYGGEGSIAYHGSMNRKSTQVTFYTPSSTSTDAIIESKARDNGFVPPADTHGYFDLVVTDYAVPHGSVTYACTSKAIPLPTGGGDRMLVAAEAIIKSDRMGGDNNNGEAFESPVHHFTVYVCGGDSYARKIAKTVACNGGNTGTAGPLANPEAQCSTFVFGYAKGITGFAYPEETGILVDGRSKKYVIMETHFDNPSDPSLSRQQQQKNIDSSGVRLYYTDTRRRHILGSIQTGDALVTLRDAPVQNNLSYQFSCPSICTSRFSQPVQLVSSFLHMHRTGRYASTNVFYPTDDNGETKLKASLNKVSFWSDKFQHARRMYKQVELVPGEQLQTSCTYDTAKRPNVTFGFSTDQEMCMDFVMYYPMQVDPITKHEINLCSFARFMGVNRTACFDAGRIREVFRRPGIFPQCSNPAFHDHVGAATNFSRSDDSDNEASNITSVCS